MVEFYVGAAVGAYCTGALYTLAIVLSAVKVPEQRLEIPASVMVLVVVGWPVALALVLLE